MEVIYCVVLSFTPSFRRCESIFRILSVAPPGTSPFAVIYNLKEDLIEGVTKGLNSYDADGTLPRIFIHCVGFIGDTH